MASAMAYDHTMAATVNCQAHFWTKRDFLSHSTLSPEYLIKVVGVWCTLCPLLAWLNGGWLPAKQYRIGGDGETLSSLIASRDWVNSGPWIDKADGFRTAQQMPV
jgi:hypothetical protein